MNGKRVPAVSAGLLIIFFFSGGILKAEAGNLLWARSAGGEGWDVGQGVASYQDGSSVVTGYFTGSANFDGNPLHSAGGRDIFIARYQAGGALAWLKRAGGTGFDEGLAVASVPDGTSVVTGWFSETAVFGPGEAQQTQLVSAGGYDMFVARYTVAGTLWWAKRAGGGSDVRGRAIASYIDGSTVVTGNFSGNAVFGPGEAGQTWLNSAGSSDIFIARYTSGGTLAWAKRAGGSTLDAVWGVAPFADGSCVITGYFEGTAVFGPGEAGQTQLVSAGNYDMFIARYNLNGSLAWAKRVGGAGWDSGRGVASYPDGSFVVTGFFNETVVFGEGEANEVTLNSGGGEDIFVAHYNADGTLAWAKRVGGAGDNGGTGIASYPDGSSVVTGYFRETVTFGVFEPNHTTLASSGLSDIFVARYNADGTLAWAKKAGGVGQDEGNAIASFADGSFTVTGFFNQTAGFDATSLISAGGRDIFVARYSDPGPDWSLPAGARAIGGAAFDSYILIANPGDQTALARVQFLGSSGIIDRTDQTVGPKSRRTVKIDDFVSHTHPSAGAVSTIVTSLNRVPVLCERAMYFPGGSGWMNWNGGHGTIGISDPSTEWNLPEGATHIFDEYIHVLNPGVIQADVQVTFMNQAAFTWHTRALVDGLSNWTIHVNSIAPGETEVSTRVNSDRPVAVDRTMYWPLGEPLGWRGGHSSRGISAPSTVWYLAEGANHLFDHYILVSNPSETRKAGVSFKFMDQDGNTESHFESIDPRSRYTVKVNDIPGWANKGQVSTMVEASISVFVERAMYWPKGGPGVWRGGHDTVASPAPAVKWQLPEGANHIFDHYVLVFNPSPTLTANVTFTFMDQDGNTTPHNKSVAPQSRYTVKVNDIPGWANKGQVSTAIESDQPILAERAMYFPKGGSAVWTDGHATVGIAE